jgi:hypothetical protein
MCVDINNAAIPYHFHHAASEASEVEKIPLEEMLAEQTLVDNWLLLYGHDYIAHAVWNGNFSLVVKSKAVLPAEAILRTRKVVEYEKGATDGSRGHATLITLSPVTISAIDKTNALTQDQQDLLEKLEAFLATKNFAEDLELLQSCPDLAFYLKSYSTLDLRPKYWREAKEYVEQHDRLLTSDERQILVEYDELNKRNQDGEEAIDQINFYQLCMKRHRLLYSMLFRLDAIKAKKRLVRELKRKSEGLDFNQYNDIGISYLKPFELNQFEEGRNLTRNQALFKLSEEKRCDETVVRIAYDQSKNSTVDAYLTRKYYKWIEKIPALRDQIVTQLYLARKHHFGASKLNCEIRAARNSVYWAYGDIAVVRGNPKDVILGNSNFDSDVTSGEVFLLPPWMNQGQFFSLPLVHPATLILGKKAALEPFAEQLKQMDAKYAYTEHLTVAQKKSFNITDS